jgi:S1-C subfamily serine protease
MSDNYPAPGSGSTSVLTPPSSMPEWIAEPPPWSQPWTPPTEPGYNGGGFGPAGPAGPWSGWQPPAPETPQRKGRRGIAILVVAALVAGLIGAAIGSQLGRSSRPQAASLVPTVPVTPGAGSGSATPGPGATSPFGGTGSTPSTPSTPSAGSGTADAAAVAGKVTPGIVDINIKLGYQSGSAAGTGMVLTASGEVLTNNHVVEGSSTISVTVPSTGKTYSATVVGTDPTEDVAIIQLQGASDMKTVPLGDSGSVKAGDSVVAMGNAGGVGGAPSVVTGTVTAVDQTITASDSNGANAETLNGLIEMNAPIQPGDSGGPLANANGQVIGMDTAASGTGRRFNTAATDAFAIPINHALSIAQQIESGKASSTVHIGLPGFIGVSIDATQSGSGAVIARVAPGTPAESAGLVAGDTITAVNSTSINSASALTAAMQGRKPGDKVTLTWTTQSGTSKSASVTLAAGPAD